MKLKTESLRSVITEASRIISRRTTLPILSHLLLDGSNGELVVSATDIDVFWRTRIKNKSGKLPPCCVPGKRFISAITSAGDDLTLESDGNGRLTLKSGWTMQLSTLPAAEFVPPPDTAKMKELGVNATDLAEGVEAVAWAAEENPADSRYWKQSVLIMATPKMLSVVASDSKVMALFQRPSICGELTMMLPAKGAELFCAAVRGEESRVLYSDRKVVVPHKHGLFASVLMEDKWPSLLESLMKTAAKPIGVIKTTDWIPALDTAVTVFDKPFCPVWLKFDGSSATIETDAKQDSYTDTLPVKGGFVRDRFRIDCKRLTDAMRKLDRDKPVKLAMLESAFQMEQGDVRVLVQTLSGT